MNTAFLATLLASLTGGKVSTYIFEFILALIPEVVEMIKELRAIEAEGPEKAKAVVETTAEFIDETMDDAIPEWKDLSEERRDRMLYGLVEWVYWGIELEDKFGKKKSKQLFKRALKKMRREV
jgi:hypothetical protein